MQPRNVTENQNPIETDSLQKPHASCGSQVHRCEVVSFFGDILYCLVETQF